MPLRSLALTTAGAVTLAAGVLLPAAAAIADVQAPAAHAVPHTTLVP